MVNMSITIYFRRYNSFICRKCFKTMLNFKIYSGKKCIQIKHIFYSIIKHQNLFLHILKIGIQHINTDRLSSSTVISTCHTQVTQSDQRDDFE